MGNRGRVKPACPAEACLPDGPNGAVSEKEGVGRELIELVSRDEAKQPIALAWLSPTPAKSLS
jgi:hypothetical protein